ncbi:hypothetical protein FRB94_014629 [Tulasnella sp. JGI-2019a]|nr:hypothetical protein FRB94_014629 [Tulasnella sp. JGI-2019a]
MGDNSAKAEIGRDVEQAVVPSLVIQPNVVELTPDQELDIQNRAYIAYDAYVLPSHVASIVDSWKGSVGAVSLVSSFLASVHTLLLTLQPAFPFKHGESKSLTVARYFSWIGILCSFAGTLAAVFMLDAMSNMTLLAKRKGTQKAMECMRLAVKGKRPPSSLSLIERLHRNPHSTDTRIKALLTVDAYEPDQTISEDAAKARYTAAVGELMRMYTTKGTPVILEEFGLRTHWKWHCRVYWWTLPFSILFAVIHLEIYVWDQDSKWNAGFHIFFLVIFTMTLISGYVPRFIP